MEPKDFERLRQGGPQCPSEVMLHRLRAGELTGEQAQATQRHVGGCEDCKARLERLAAGFAAFPEADPIRMMAAIRRGVDAQPPRLAARWRLWLRSALVPLAAVAAALILVVALRPGDSPHPPGLRAKGGPLLHVFRLKDGAAVEALSGERFTPGESLQLTVDVPADSLVRVIGIEAGGTLYPIWPQGGGEAFAPMKAGSGQRIPGALTLDETPGPEHFHVIACAPRAVPPSCRSHGASDPPACSEGCQSSAFILRKGK
jgi:hypothetical protein